VGFEPTIPAFERAKAVPAVDLAATAIGIAGCQRFRYVLSYRGASFHKVGSGNAVMVTAYSFSLIRLVGGGVQLGPLGTAATDWAIVACPG
jgi:hypothetical protein